MCSPSDLIFILIASLLFNCLHFNFATFNGGSANNTSARRLGHAVEDASRADIVGRHIDITRKPSLYLNGIEIDENSIVDHLEEHERELIFGKSRKKRAVKLVHLRFRTDADVGTGPDKAVDAGRYSKTTTRSTSATITAATASTSPSSPTIQSRVKRSDNGSSTSGQSGASHSAEVSVRIKDSDQLVNLRLRQTPQLVDDAFVFIRRSANSSQLIENSHKLAAQYEHCFYRNDNSALDLCVDGNVRGVLHHNSTDLILHPLPERFGTFAHVIFESSPLRDGSPLQSNLGTSEEGARFEPEEIDFPKLRPGVVEIEQHNNNHHNQSNLHHHQHHQYHHDPLHVPLSLRYKPRFQHHYHPQHLKGTRSYREHRSQHHYQRENPAKRRQRRHIGDGIPEVLHIETAIFVDNDLFKHMAKNFPSNTENHLIRFVLAMINGVQLLYHDPTLGHRVNFVLKRLEVLEKDPPDLRRSSDIDIYLSNFCKWQNSWNPQMDSEPFHYDHAVILTGLDLYVMGKNGKVISQVVGLAPVAGMCIPTSSCTINEGKHFESVFVVAHEIGHNLGMRHDTTENSCDPSLHIMSPTLGSGKNTWSKCSRTYLDTFLRSYQAKCLFDRGKVTQDLDHSGDGMLPGERFNANQQCMLKYGKDSVRAPSQSLADICHDLHCQRDRYTWTSHPALEGTACGENMWCRRGVCVVKRMESYNAAKQVTSLSKSTYDKAGFLESSKMGHLLHEHNYNKPSSWSEWGEASECDSFCLYGPSKRLREGSTGLKTFTRKCLDYKRRCLGRDRKFESCIAKQCYSTNLTTIEDFARQVCERAQKFDAELSGEGQQIVGDMEESCRVFCKTKSNGTKSRSWTFPDGTTCHSRLYNYYDTSYCIKGRCEKFSCDNSTSNYYKINQTFCKRSQVQHNSVASESPGPVNGYQNVIPKTAIRYAEKEITFEHSRGVVGGSYGGEMGGAIYGPTTVRSKFENEVAVRSFHGQTTHHYPRKRKQEPYSVWNKYSYQVNQHIPAAASQPVSASLIAAAQSESANEWVVKSGCHSSCMAKSKGIQVVTSRKTGAKNIQLCTHTVKPCDRLLTATEYAKNTCARYKLKVRGLSGYGTQIAASVDNPDRSCRVGCQDEHLKHRFYLVNGNYGHFPLGTKCSATEERYCVNGKCLEFGVDNIPLQESHISLALFRNRRSLEKRRKRSYLYYNPINITETVTQEFINDIVNSITSFEEQHWRDDLISNDHIEFTNPIHYSIDELTVN